MRITADLIKGYPQQSWHLSEWLINYQGGFVRRGLPGEILLAISTYTHISPYYYIIAITLLSFLLLMMFFWSKTKSLPDRAILLSSLFMGMPVFSNFWIRKDVILLLIFVICLYLLRSVSLIRLLAANVFSSVAILSHESYGFWGLGGLLLVLIHQYHSLNCHWLRRIVLAFSSLLPASITFLFCLYFKGYPGINDIIQQSWNDIHFPVTHPSSSPNAIDALTWSLSDGLRYSFSIFRECANGFLYVPLMWLLNILFMMALLIRLVNARAFQEHCIVVLSVQCCFVLPLFILGFDYGRWVFFWLSSSLAIGYIIQPFQPHMLSVNNITHPIVGWVATINQLLQRIDLRWFYFLLLFTAIPHCCWSIQHLIKCMPAFQPILLILRIIGWKTGNPSISF